jgi:glutaredoxin
MKELTIFYLEGCPYCRKARAAIEELKSVNPGFGKVTVRWIEETLSPEIADRYNYYRVPSIFFGDEKLYECSPGDDYSEIRRQAERALTAAAGK